MSDGDKKKSFLSKVFNKKTAMKAAWMGLSFAFGFAVVGAFDFILFHQLPEGLAFMTAAEPLVTDVLRTDVGGFSVAGMFTSAAEWLTNYYPAEMTMTDIGNGLAAQQGTAIPGL